MMMDLLNFPPGHLPSQTHKRTPKTRFSESRFSEILDLMNKLELPF